MLQVLLAVFFLPAGYTHGLVPIAQAAKAVPWITSVPVALARFIGVAEVAGAIGLVLPAASRVAPWLTPLAAIGLSLIMVLAALFHIMRGEATVIGFHIIVAALAAFVAWGRWRRAPIASRT
jgi:uncharacterized membrane protein